MEIMRGMFKQRIKFLSTEHGIGLIEIIVAISVISLTLLGTITAFQFHLRAGLDTTDRIRAIYLLEEGMEAARFLRDTGWTGSLSALSSGTPYHLATTSVGWDATTTPVLIDGTFFRTVIVSDVYRKTADDDIVPESASDSKVLDPGTKRILVRVTWSDRSETAVGFESGNTDTNLALFPSDDAGDGDPAQGFVTPPKSIDVEAVDLLLRRATSSAPSDVFLEIRSGSPTGSVVASSTTLFGAVITDSAFTWTTFPFPATTTLATSTSYYLRLSSDPESTDPGTGSSGAIHWGYHAGSPDPYAGGMAWRYVGSSVRSAEALPSADFSFRVRIAGTESVEAVTYLTDLFGN